MINKQITKSFYLRPNRNIVKINSEEEYNSLFKELRKAPKEEKNAILASKLVFNSLEEHMFKVSSKVNNVSGYYVSEKLKNEIMEKGFTGMDFKPLKEINPNIDIEIT